MQSPLKIIQSKMTSLLAVTLQTPDRSLHEEGVLDLSFESWKKKIGTKIYWYYGSQQE